jgi:D-glycero-alpha-D-manno-heptose 1-phosphate guanylyltransferase
LRGNRGGIIITQAVILAGGQGTRIRDLTKDKISKVMLPVNGKPFLYYIINYLKGEGIKDIVLCVGHKKNSIKEYFGKGHALGVNITYSEEEKPLGTAGAIKNAERFISDETFFVLNGDTFFPVNLKELFNFHRSKNAIITIALKEHFDCFRYGKVELDKNNRITVFIEKGQHQQGLINGGVYVVEKQVLNLIKKGTPVSLEKDLLPALANGDLFGKAFDNYFIDIGIPEDYERAKQEFR